jgi:hypothetical protein
VRCRARKDTIRRIVIISPDAIVLITESELREMIRGELRKDILNEDTLSIACKLVPAGKAKAACYGATWLYARIPYTEYFTETAIGTYLPAATTFLGASPAATAALATGASLLAAFTFVYGTFMAFPEVMSAQMEFLDKAEGFIMNLQKHRLTLNKDSGPLEFNDISSKPAYPSLGMITWDRDSIIDFLAAGSDTKEGRSLIGKLTASGNWKMPGVFLSPSELFGDGYPGPIIGKSLAIKIQQRRKEMVDEATDKAREQLLARVKKSYEEGDFTKIIKFAMSLGWDPERREYF